MFINDNSIENDIINLCMLCTLIKNDFHHLHLYAQGDKFITLHKLTENYEFALSGDYDIFTELGVELGINIPNASLALKYIENYTPQSDYEYTYDQIISICKNLIQLLLEKVTTFRNNVQNESMKSKLDDDIRYWATILLIKI